MSRSSRTTASDGLPSGLEKPPAVSSRSRLSRAAVVATLAVSLSGGALLTASSASAAVPTFPDNVVVFPNRDFVTIEGYQDHIGETATIEVKRPGVGTIGSAEGKVEEGDVAFEVNHPGGYCWGAGTGLNVTPDIQPGDVVSIRFGNTEAGETIAQDAFVDSDASITTTTVDGTTVLVKGHIGADVIQDNTEQRIVEPALTDTDVARRDVRAVPGPMTRAPKGGYSSMLEFNDDDHTFLATYVFDREATAEIAANAGLGERLLSWQVVDADANRQGLTIAEFGEPGGPGMGGCPNGPLQSGPPAPTSISAAKVSGGIKLTWTPAQAIPGTPAITGYRATAVAQSSINNQQVEIGRRITGQGATGTTITGLDSNETYDIDVVSVSSVGETFPAAHAVPVTDVTPPTVASSSTGGAFAVPQKVTLTANESGSQIFFTTDGVDPVAGDTLAASATVYTGALTISSNTTLKFVAFDPSGNVSQIGEATFTITNTPTPDAPTFGTPVIGQGQVTLSWTSSDPSVTGYTVTAYRQDNSVVSTRSTTNTTVTVDGLQESVPYFFTIRASNANGQGPESAKLGPLTVQGAVVANAGPDQVGVARNSTVNLTGAGSTAGGATYLWTQLSTGTSNPIGTNDFDRVSLTNATSRDARFVLPFYNYRMSTKPLTFQLAVTANGTTRTDAVVITPSSDRVTIGTSKWKNNDFRATGTSSTVGGTITIRSAPNAAGVSTVYGTATVTAAPAPEVGGVWDFRLRTGVPTTNPGQIYADSNRGGTAGPFTVANG